jgi:hypothetical protein
VCSPLSSKKCDKKWLTGAEFTEFIQRAKSSFQISKGFVAGLPLIQGSSGYQVTHEFQTTMPFQRGSLMPERTLRGPNGTKCDVPKRPIVFGDLIEYAITCYPEVVYLDAEIGCTRVSAGQPQCATRRVRRSLDETNLCSSITEIDIMNQTNYDPLNYMLKVFWNPRDGSPPSMAEQFLMNPAGVFKNYSWLDTTGSTSTYNMTTIPPPVFANRLTMLWNTWSMATKDNGLLTGSQFVQSPFKYAFHDGITTISSDEQLLVNSNATWTHETGIVYRVHIAWLVVYVVSALMLLACSLCSCVARLRLNIPEVLGHVSSLARDSPYVALSMPTAGSTLDGSLRAVLLKNLWIRLQDVQAEEEVGRLAVSLCSERVEERDPLNREKFYE